MLKISVTARCSCLTQGSGVRGQGNAVPLECPAILSHWSASWVSRTVRNVQRTWEVWFEFILLQPQLPWYQADSYRILVHFFYTAPKQRLVKILQSSKTIQYRAFLKEHKFKTVAVKMEKACACEEPSLINFLSPLWILCREGSACFLGGRRDGCV